MNTQTEPKPCPFCGGPASYQQGGEGSKRWYGCSCEDWNCQGHNGRLSHKTALNAVKAWNTRAAIATDRAKRVAGPVLTDEEIKHIAITTSDSDLQAVVPFVRAIEAAVLAKIKESS
ncbi:MAG: hypothetical protein EPN62_05695 [Candidimonas sp.]|nr:MAG: hypothetical protein EPN77_16750 [Candidimonas sp.]TAM24800.1 MAG: hypothetical protein EPN62_05695 [Candidimonas sp.]